VSRAMPTREIPLNTPLIPPYKHPIPPIKHPPLRGVLGTSTDARARTKTQLRSRMMAGGERAGAMPMRRGSPIVAPGSSSSSRRHAKFLQRQLYGLLSSPLGILAALATAVAAVLTINTLLSALRMLAAVPRAAHRSVDGGCACDRDRSPGGQICAPVIDVVYTWVNGSDAAFIQQLRRYKAEWYREHGEGEAGAPLPPPPPPPPPPPHTGKTKERGKKFNDYDSFDDWDRDGFYGDTTRKKTAAEEDADAVSAGRWEAGLSKYTR